MPIIFSCSIENNEVPVNICFEKLFDYCGFKIEFNLSDVSIFFESDVMTTDGEDIEMFVNNFLNNRSCSVSFNSGNGSSIEYSDGTLSFGVYTYVEGTATSLCNEIKVNNNNRSDLNNVFRQLLDFKITFDSIELLDKDEYEYEEEQPEQN